MFPFVGIVETHFEKWTATFYLSFVLISAFGAMPIVSNLDLISHTFHRGRVVLADLVVPRTNAVLLGGARLLGAVADPVRSTTMGSDIP